MHASEAKLEFPHQSWPSTGATARSRLQTKRNKKGLEFAWRMWMRGVEPRSTAYNYLQPNQSSSEVHRARRLLE